MEQKAKEYIYYVQGMHCASCEILIEKKVLEIEGIESAEASTAKGQLLLVSRGKELSPEMLNKIFTGSGYIFSGKPFLNQKSAVGVNGWLIFSVSLLIISIFYFLQKTGLGSLATLNSKSGYLSFLVFGVLAGVSSCAALVGGLVLSMSKQWSELYSDKDSFWQKSQPHLLFNAGRLISYGLLGGILGLIGEKLQFSITASSILVFAISILMVFLALQMLGIKAFQKFQITIPKFITKKIADESNFHGRLIPFVLGGLTFFLPCGFTLTAQGTALLSGSALNGGLIMFLFALGTSPTLLAIGLTSIKFIKNHRLSANFLKTAAILILFFALFNINSQLNILGVPSFSSLAGQITKGNGTDSQAQSDKDLAPVIAGKQILKMRASSSGYSPNYFKVRAGVPVRWEIFDTGTSGCTNAIISRNLFDGEIALTPGQTSIEEFTPAKAGKYRFSCWMGMVSGTIEVANPI
ncbi:sulfite exporter TauE/SafE family protein [Patescibacteria group bacterium]|nr:sulfite exporter TauE/SafE family protein [Patescibacteria group bacterium]